MGQLWSPSADGGYMYSDNLSSKLRLAVQPLTRFQQFCDAKEAFGKSKGDTFNWNVYSDVATQGTTLAEQATMPETKFTITQESLTITEAGNSVPFTSKLDSLSEHPVTEVIEQVLKNDARKAMDTLAHAQFNATKLVVCPTSGTSTTAVTLETDGSHSVTNSVEFGTGHVKAISDIMVERNIPSFDGENYIAIGRPTTFRTMKNSLETINQYTSEGYGKIVNGEVGRYEGFRFVQQTNIASDAWTNGKSDDIYFFGADTVTEAIAIDIELRGKIATDYGRDKGIAWYYLGGFGINHTQAAQSRIVKWDSAA